MATHTKRNMETPANSHERDTVAVFERAQDALFDAVGLDVRSQFVELESPRGRIHVLEIGPPSEDPPLVFVHGTAEFGAFLAPLMGEFDGVRMLTFDRPGYGLSDGFVYTESTVRRTLVDVLEGVLDAMDVERADLVGHSMGGHASLLFARSHPERVRGLFLVGGVPAFPGTHPPLPFRLLSVPVLNDVIRRVQKSGEAGVYDIASIFGEGAVIRKHPAFVRAIAAHEADPKSALAGRSEFGALISAWGWRSSVRFNDVELRSVSQPTTIVWGAHDPLGSPGEVRRGVELIPDVRFETVDAGHIPYLAHPERCAAFIREGRGESGDSGN
ncbi:MULTISPECIES: alpha/beta fold hydrolase [Haloferax]|nr:MULTISPECIES: alpha/beta hydrolase [Haloferax]